MGCQDPRERKDLCGQELGQGLFSEELADEFDDRTWYEAENGGHYCCREVWDGADDGRCIWHADISWKPPDELIASLPDMPARLDRAILRDVVFPEKVDFTGCHLRNADLGSVGLLGSDLAGANLSDADLGDAHLSDADLSDANLTGADLSGANLPDADLGDAHLWTTNLNGANLRDADASKANFRGADLSGANLQGANTRGANLQGADLSGTNLRGTDTNGANLRGVDLSACKLHQTSFENVTFNEATTFGTASGYEIETDEEATDESWLATHVSSRFRALGRPSIHPLRLELAETQYRTIQRLKREHDLKQDINLEIQEKHARRKRALAERRYWDWFKLAFYRWPMGYGEKPGHVVGTSLVVIAASTLAYQLFAPVARTPAPDSADVVGGTLLSSLPITPPPWVGELLTSLYFSVVTFTTLGYGDLQPTSGAAQAVATLESFLGALLMALLVFVLGRRATW